MKDKGKRQPLGLDESDQEMVMHIGCILGITLTVAVFFGLLALLFGPDAIGVVVFGSIVLSVIGIIGAAIYIAWHRYQANREYFEATND